MNKRPLLVYCAYPIIDRDSEPNWVTILEYVISNKILEDIYIYRPFYSIESQESLHPVLENKNSTDLGFLLEALQLENQYSPTSLKEALEAENHGGYANRLVGKELWVLANSDIVVADCDLSDRGDRDMILMSARLLAQPTVGVCNKFITGPWLNALTKYKASDKDLPDLLKLIANGIWQEEKEEPVEAVKENKEEGKDVL